MIKSMYLLCVTLCVSVLIRTAFCDGWGGGSSHTFRKQTSAKGQGDYAFGYDIHDPWGASNFRKERGAFTKKDGWVEGMYGLKDKDGRARLVKYVADKGGFRASIKTNEPGTSGEDAANAYYNGPDNKSGKWSYDVSIKDDGKGWKNAKDQDRALTNIKSVQVRPKRSVEQQEAAESRYQPQTRDSQIKKLKLHLKPQYDYYYGSPAQERV